MSGRVETSREGSLEAPKRHPIQWRDPDFYDHGSLFQELARIYDICHGCRRCFSLCNAFPTLFEAIDESRTMELDGVAKAVYWDVVDHCYLCDMCFMTKCPYVPPHEWNVDFPHLMLRAKAVKYNNRKTGVRDRLLSNTDLVGKLAGIPVVNTVANATLHNRSARKLLDKIMRVHADAHVPDYHRDTLRKTAAPGGVAAPLAAAPTRGRVALFATCYGNYNEPQIGHDLIAVFEHNGIEVRLLPAEVCCAMPKLELGDLEAVAAAKDTNVPILTSLIDDGWDIVAPVPSCVLMFKQELPLMFPHDDDVLRVRTAIFDPFEYLMHRHKASMFNTEFSKPLGKIAYHVACHLRVQNIGMKTRDILSLVPGTEISVIERCSGHNGTYAVKREFHQVSMKIAAPVINRVKQGAVDYYSSDCPMAGHQLANGMGDGSAPIHPLSLLRLAYGI